MKKIIVSAICLVILCSCGAEKKLTADSEPTPFAGAEPSSLPSEEPQNNPAPEPTAATDVKPTVKPTAAPDVKPTAAPEEKPVYEAVQNTEPPVHEQVKAQCTLSVSCAQILDNMDKLKPEKAAIIPQGGVILAAEDFEIQNGDTAFSLLQRELRRRKIHMEFNYTPVYDSCYIEGIANIYEMDCGSESGWLYMINGEQPEVGANQYELKNGDKIEFYYICNR